MIVSAWSCVSDIIAASVLISSVWSLIAVLFRLRVIWVYYAAFVLPMSILVSFGLYYFGIIQCLEKSISS